MTRPMFLLFVLAACSPQQLADDVTRQAAESVVVPILEDYMPAPQAKGASVCILDNATPDELRMIARDVAVYAGSSTVRNVLAIAQRPATLACFRTVGVSSLPSEWTF
ncbi:MAG: hypothetical protein ACRC6I_07005 [Paracoccaceae bacterium]